MAKHARWVISVVCLTCALAAVAFSDFGSVQAIDRLLLPPPSKVPLSNAVEEELLPGSRHAVRINLRGIINSAEPFSGDNSLPEKQPWLQLNRPVDPLFDFWLFMQSGQGLSDEQLYRQFRELTAEQINTLKRLRSLYFEGVLEVLLYGPLIPAKGETSEQYLQDNRIVPPHILRKLNRLLVEACFSQWCRSGKTFRVEDFRVKGDGYLQEPVESGRKNRKGKVLFSIGSSSSARGSLPSKSGILSVAADGGGGEPYRPWNIRTGEKRDKKNMRAVDILPPAGLVIESTPGDDHCMFHAISSQLPLFRYQFSGLELRKMTGDFLTLMKQHNLSPEQLIPEILKTVPDDELFNEQEREKLSIELEREKLSIEEIADKKAERFYLKMISFFNSQAVVEGIPLTSTEFPNQMNLTSRLWGDEIHLTLLSHLFYFYTIIISKTASGEQIYIIPPAGEILNLEKAHSLIRLFGYISRNDRTLSLEDYSSWMKKEKELIQASLDTITEQHEEYKALSARMQRFDKIPEITYSPRSSPRPVVLLLYEGHQEPEHYSMVKFKHEHRALAQIYGHNLDHFEFMLPPEELRSDVLECPAGQPEEILSVSAVPLPPEPPSPEAPGQETVTTQNSEASEAPEQSTQATHDAGASEATRKKRRKKKSKSKKKPATDGVNPGFVLTEVSFNPKTDEPRETDPQSGSDSSPEEVSEEKGTEKKDTHSKDKDALENSAEKNTLNGDLTHLQPEDTSSPLSAEPESAEPESAEPEPAPTAKEFQGRQKKRDKSSKKRGEGEPSKTAKTVKEKPSAQAGSLKQPLVFSSRQDEELDIKEAGEWLKEIDKQLAAHLSDSLEALQDQLASSPVPDSLDKIMKQGLLKTGIALKMLDARLDGTVISVHRRQAAKVMALVEESAKSHLCPYGNLLYGLLQIPEKTFSEQSFSDALMPLLQASVSGVAQASQLVSAMVLNHHPADYPQIALWNHLMEMADNGSPLAYSIHIAEPENSLLKALHDDPHFHEQLAFSQQSPDPKKHPGFKPPVPYQLGLALRKNKFNTVHFDLPAPYEKTRALLNLLVNRRVQPAAGQVKSRYWMQGLKLIGKFHQVPKGKNKFAPVNKAVPLASSDLALYNGIQSLNAAEHLVRDQPAEKMSMQQFQALFKAIIMLSDPEQSGKQGSGLNPAELTSRLFMAAFNIKIADRYEKLRTELIALNKELDDEFAALGDRITEFRQKSTEETPEPEKIRKTVREPKKKKSVHSKKATQTQQGAKHADVDLVELDQRILRGITYNKKADDWYRSVRSLNQKSSLTPDEEAEAGYYSFMAALQLLRPELDEGHKQRIYLTRLGTPLPTSVFIPVCDYLNKSRQHGFPYASLLRTVVEAYGTPNSPKKEINPKKRIDFFLAANEWLFEACWAGAEQAYSTLFYVTLHSHPWWPKGNVGVTALFLRLFEKELPPYRLSFHIKHDAKLLQSRLLYQTVLYPIAEKLVFIAWLATIRQGGSITSALEQDDMESMLNQAVSLYASRVGEGHYAPNVLKSRIFYMQMLVAIFSGDAFQLKISDYGFFVEKVNIPWLLTPLEPWALALTELHKHGHCCITNRHRHNRVDEYCSLLDSLATQGGRIYDYPKLLEEAGSQLEPLLLLSDPFSLRPPFILEVHSLIPKMQSSPEWFSRIILLYLRLNKPDDGFVSSRGLPALITAVPKEIFQHEEQKYARLLKTQAESRYDALYEEGTELLSEAEVKDDTTELPDPMPQDLVDIELWRAHGDRYFIDCYKKALELEWHSIKALSEQIYESCTSCTDVEQDMKLGIYETILGLMKLKASLNANETGFDINMTDIPDRADVLQALDYFRQARRHGFPYGGYLFALTEMSQRPDGYLFEVSIEDTSSLRTNIIDYDRMALYTDFFSGVLESAVAGFRQAVLDLMVYYSLDDKQPTFHKNAGLAALVAQWHLVTPFVYKLTFNFFNLALSGYLQRLVLRLNDQAMRKVFSDSFDACTDADESCFVDLVRQGSKNLKIHETVYMEMLLACITDNPDDLLQLIKQPDVMEKVQPHTLPLVLNWEERFDFHGDFGTKFLSNEDFGTSSHQLRYLAMSLLSFAGIERQQMMHKKIADAAPRMQHILLYATFDPFVNNKKIRENLLHNFGEDMPEIAEHYAVHELIRYMWAIALDKMADARKHQETIIGLIKKYSRQQLDIGWTLSLFFKNYEFHTGKKLTFEETVLEE